ncbi:phage portal protein [Clostridium sp. YIM B02505]|uniref:Phage portal protein n=1 Tax=Clostridium yunnanense TaxID=2800325 RepID=A0ABS1EIH0_9CLOT|nr:phage portal protein [Clostridium yunnanense]MBK1809145.1 phage portal protein [Clostridium yunnanense]
MIFDRLNREKRDINVNDWQDIYSFEKGYDNSVFDRNMKNSTYFSCVKIKSEAIAKCTLQIKQETDKGEVLAKDHYLYDMLRLRPNSYMSAIDCYKTFVALAIHRGIAGLYINRKGSKIEGLYPVKLIGCTIDDVGIIRTNKNNAVYWDYESINGETGSCFDKDVIVLRDFTLDGINGKAVKNVLKDSLDTAIKSENYLNSLFSNGLTNKVVVQLTSDIKEESELKKVQSKFSRIYSNNGRVFTVPSGFNVSALNLSLVDSQFAELRFMSKKDMAAAMGVPLTKLGEAKDTAKSEEQDNLAFLTDTLQIIFEAIEQEMDWKLLTSTERKLGYKIRFNTNVMLRMDSLTQANVISTYVKDGIYSLNTAKEILGIEKLDKDVTTFPSGQITLEALMSGMASWQKDSAKVGDNNNDTSGS